MTVKELCELAVKAFDIREASYKPIEKDGSGYYTKWYGDSAKEVIPESAPEYPLVYIMSATPHAIEYARNYLAKENAK